MVNSRIQKLYKGTNKMPSEIQISDPVPVNEDADIFLKQLVILVNKTNRSIKISLNVQGSFIAGGIISGKRYFEIYKEQFNNAEYGNSSDELKKTLDTLMTSNSEAYSLNDLHNIKEEIHRTTYIHLDNVKIFCGSKEFNSPLPWRGKISTVNGFILLSEAS